MEREWEEKSYKRRGLLTKSHPRKWLEIIWRKDKRRDEVDIRTEVKRNSDSVRYSTFTRSENTLILNKSFN